jgi:hypothetical protein
LDFRPRAEELKIPPAAWDAGRRSEVRDPRSEIRDPRSAFSFQFSGDEKFLRGVVVLDAKDIGLAANLAIFDVALAASSGLIHGGGVPFSARCALEAGFHGERIPQRFTLAAELTSANTSESVSG